MIIEGWYYLHTNGDLIYKRELGDTVADLRESDFVRMIWPFDPTDRAGAWRILVEGLSLGADKSRINELANKWGCDNNDAGNYADYLKINLYVDGDSWFATREDFVNLQESPYGLGDTALYALAYLCKTLGFKQSKMWGSTFVDLVSK